MVFDLIPGGENRLFYSRSGSMESQCIGHVRFDFGDGYGFWHAWWPHSADEAHNKEPFKQELNALITYLRSDILQCYNTAVRRIAEMRLPAVGDDSMYAGFHVLTPGHAYYVRLCTAKGNYSYNYCYVRSDAKENPDGSGDEKGVDANG